MRQHLFGELLHEISFLYNDAVVSVNGAVVAVVEIQVVTVMVLLLQLWKFKSFFLWSSAVRSGEKKSPSYQNFLLFRCALDTA